MGTATKRIHALMRVTCCRYAAYYFLPCWVPLAEGYGKQLPLWVAPAVALFWFIFSMGTETANRVSDEVEDRINQAERTALCDVAGFGLMKKLCVISWVIVSGSWIAMAWFQQNGLLAVLLGVSMFVALSYSFGLKVKGMRYAANLFLALPFIGPFLTGWALGHPQMNAHASAPNLGWLMLITGLFSITVGGVKDITDAEGDAAIGYNSVWVSLSRSGMARSLLYVALPYLVLIVPLALGQLPLRFACLLPFFIFAIFTAVVVQRAERPEQQAVVREFNYHYWFAFLTVAVVLWFPEPTTIWASVGTWIYWLACTHFLHWSGGLKNGRWKILVDLVTNRATPIEQSGVTQ